MSTERHDKVRVIFQGCSHRPRRSAMAAPRVGEEAMCYTCGRTRIVTGMTSTLHNAVIKCQSCTWKYENNGRLGKKKLLLLAMRHSNRFLHRVSLVTEGNLVVIKPQSFQQLPLIDDLLLP